MQRVQLFSIDQRKIDAWLNDTSRRDSDFTEQVCLEIARYTAFIDDVPSALRINPCTIFELPSNRWEAFPFFYEGRIVEITIIADQTVPRGEIVCKRSMKGQND